MSGCLIKKLNKPNPASKFAGGVIGSGKMLESSGSAFSKSSHTILTAQSVQTSRIWLEGQLSYGCSAIFAFNVHFRNIIHLALESSLAGPCVKFLEGHKTKITWLIKNDLLDFGSYYLFGPSIVF